MTSIKKKKHSLRLQISVFSSKLYTFVFQIVDIITAEVLQQVAYAYGMTRKEFGFEKTTQLAFQVSKMYTHSDQLFLFIPSISPALPHSLPFSSFFFHVSLQSSTSPRPI